MAINDYVDSIMRGEIITLSGGIPEVSGIRPGSQLFNSFLPAILIDGFSYKCPVLLANTNPYKVTQFIGQFQAEVVHIKSDKRGKKLLVASPLDKSLEFRGQEIFVDGFDFVVSDDRLYFRGEPNEQALEITSNSLRTPYTPRIDCLDKFVLMHMRNPASWDVNYSKGDAQGDKFYFISEGKPKLIELNQITDRKHALLTMKREFAENFGEGIPFVVFTNYPYQTAHDTAAGLFRANGIDAVRLIPAGERYVIGF
jgi:hypothetical protein